MRLEYIYAIVLVVLGGLTLLIVSRLDPWTQGLTAGALFGAIASTPIMMFAAGCYDRDRDATDATPPAVTVQPPAPAPAIEWHAYSQAYMPARTRNERPAALVAATQPALRGVDWLPLSVGSLLDALRSVPGAAVTPPHDGYSAGVLISTRDPAFIAAVRATMPNTVGDVQMYSAAATRRCLLREGWRNGRPVEAGYMRQDEMAHTPEHYWIVRPAGPSAGGIVPVAGPDEFVDEW